MANIRANSRKVHRPENDMSGGCQARADNRRRVCIIAVRVRITELRVRIIAVRVRIIAVRVRIIALRVRVLAGDPSRALRQRQIGRAQYCMLLPCGAALSGLCPRRAFKECGALGREGAACAGLSGPGAPADLQSCTRCKFATKSRIDPERQERRCCCARSSKSRTCGPEATDKETGEAEVL
jgi:hypothetical protein